jgi:hypothetical protein
MSTTVAAGTISPASLPRLFGRIYRERSDGRLVVEHDGGRSVAYFRKGRPVGVNVFARFKPLGMILLESGMIDVQTLDASLAEKSRKDILHGQVLLEMGAIDEEKLRVGLRKQHQANLGVLLQVGEGSYQLEHGGELPEWTRDVGLSAHEAVLGHLALPENRPAVDALLRLLGGERFVLTDAWHAGWTAFEMSRTEYDALSLFAEAKTLAEVVEAGAVDTERLGILIAALSCFGIIAAAR